MKKHYYLLACLLFSVPAAFAATDNAPVMPDSLQCNGVKFLAGLKNFSTISNYFPMVIQNLNGGAALLTDTSGNVGGAPGSVSVKAGVVTVDFSESDQYSFFKFNADDLAALASGKTENIVGTYEDGFDWTDGYNTRAQFSVSCTL